MVTWVLYLCVGVVIGGIAGFYFAKLDDFSKKQKRELEEKLKNSETDLLNYKQQVTHHFKETAELVNNMTESYQKVHEHLAIGASTLCNNEVEVSRIQVTRHEKKLTHNQNNKLLPETNSSTEIEAPKPTAEQGNVFPETASDSARQASDVSLTPVRLESEENIIIRDTIEQSSPQEVPSPKILDEANAPQTNASQTNTSQTTEAPVVHPPPSADQAPSAASNTEDDNSPQNKALDNQAVSDAKAAPAAHNTVTETMAVVDDDSIKHEPESVTVADPTATTTQKEGKSSPESRTVH